MFGYRYDTETGLYYLQSRYYNPEWGRFINADGIIGQNGELLGHNLFSYCKNNPINMHDDNGDRPDFSSNCTGHETQDDIDASVACMSKTNYQRYRKKQDEQEKMESEIISVAISGTSVALDKKIGDTVAEVIPKYIYTGVNRAVCRGTELPTGIIETGGIAAGTRAITKAGIIGAVLTGMCVWDNYHSGYSKSEAFERSAIDVGISIVVITIGLSNPVGWTVFAGLALCTAGEVAKNYIWKKE